MHGGAAVPVLTANAQPNPWEAGVAFDGNSATFWSTWQARSQDDFIQGSFDARLIDEVIVESAATTGADVVIEVLQADGRRAGITEKVEESRVSAPEGMRMAASRAVLKFGIHFLLVNEGDLIAEDLKKNMSAWGVGLVSEVNRVRLYRIER